MRVLQLVKTSVITAFTIACCLQVANWVASPVSAQVHSSFGFNAFTAGGAKVAGMPFEIIITAQDASSNTVTSFTGQAVLSDSTGTIYPTLTSNFTSGVWRGYVYITEATNNTVITATTGMISNNSASFAVNPDTRIKFMTIISGNNQTGTVNTQLSQALTAKVADPFNNPIANQPVNFTITAYPTGATGQQLGSSSGNSDTGGLISTTMTLGRKSGPYVVTASLASGISSSVTFYQTATAANLLSLQLTPSVSVLPKGTIQAFTVKGYDMFQNEKPLSSVTWSVINGGGSIDSTGVFTAGSTVGTYLNTVRAASGAVGTTASVTVIDEVISGGGVGTGSGSGSGTGPGASPGPTPTPSPTASPVPTATPGPSTTPGASPGAGVLNTVVVDPSVITALKDAKIPIVAEAFDIYGQSVANVNFTFEVSGTLGSLTQTSTNTVLLTASETGVGTVTITAQQGDVVRVARIVGSVGTGLNRRLIIEPVASPQQVGIPFTVSIAAKDTLNNFITDYEGPIVLADTTGTIDPSLVQPNGEGVWFVQAIISLGHPEISITAAGDGMVGVSNIFEVQGEPRLSDIPPAGALAAGAGGAGGGGLGDVLGASISGRLKDLLLDKDLNRYTIARFIGAGLAAGIGIFGASLGGGIMASRGLEALGRNPFARAKLKFNLYMGVLAFVIASGLAVAAAYIIVG